LVLELVFAPRSLFARVTTVKVLLLEAYLSRRADLKRFLAIRLGSEEEAEDVVQELFLKIERSTGIDANVRSPAAYLFTMALNLSRSYRRERLRARRRDGQWVETNNVMAGPDAIADAPSADSVYDAKQRIEQVAAALEKLSPQCRNVFRLHKFEGLSHAEVAARLGISRSTVEKHMTTALKALLRMVDRAPVAEVQHDGNRAQSDHAGMGDARPPASSYDREQPSIHRSRDKAVKGIRER